MWEINQPIISVELPHYSKEKVRIIFCVSSNYWWWIIHFPPDHAAIASFSKTKQRLREGDKIYALVRLLPMSERKWLIELLCSAANVPGTNERVQSSEKRGSAMNSRRIKPSIFLRSQQAIRSPSKGPSPSWCRYAKCGLPEIQSSVAKPGQVLAKSENHRGAQSSEHVWPPSSTTTERRRQSRSSS